MVANIYSAQKPTLPLMKTWASMEQSKLLKDSGTISTLKTISTAITMMITIMKIMKECLSTHW